MYYKFINERQVFSDCKTIQLEYDHLDRGLHAGQWVSNPDEQLCFDDGWQIYIPPVIPPEPHTDPGMDELMEAVKKMLSPSVETLSDEDAIAVAALFPTWISMMDKEVKVGERYWYDERLWKVLLDHTVQESWTPDVSPSLFVQVTIDEWPEWVQPIASTDAYNAGDKVSHNEKHWISDVDSNVWEPGVYGWTEQ